MAIQQDKIFNYSALTPSSSDLINLASTLSAAEGTPLTDLEPYSLTLRPGLRDLTPPKPGHYNSGSYGPGSVGLGIPTYSLP